jgi:hypothetical protein
MRYGAQSLWGLESLWGIDLSPFVVEYCQLADERILVQMDDTGGNNDFRMYMCEMVRPWGEYTQVLRDIENAFDVTTAVGEQLDYLGEIVGIPRREFDDARYRTFIAIQIDLILSAARAGANWTGTVNNILTICRTFIGSGPTPIILRNYSPYSYDLQLPAIPVDERNTLLDFICKATYAGVLGQILIDNGMLWGSAIGTGIPGAKVWGSAIGTPILDEGTWGSVVTIGADNC